MTAKRLTLKSVNKALAERGAKEELFYNRQGYYYFAEGNTRRWQSTIVYVPRLNDLTIEQWVAEWENLSNNLN